MRGSFGENFHADPFFLLICPPGWLKKYDGRIRNPLGISSIVDAFRANPYLSVIRLPEVLHRSDLVSISIEGSCLYTATLEEQQSNTDCIRVRALNVCGEHLSRSNLIITCCHGVTHLLRCVRKVAGIDADGAR